MVTTDFSRTLLGLFKRENKVALKGRTPTAEEKHWLDAISDMGCIVCQQQLGVYTPSEVHHLEGKTRPGSHSMTIKLCPPHHRWHMNTPECVSLHPYKAEFIKRYGTELELLEATRQRVSELDGM